MPVRQLLILLLQHLLSELSVGNDDVESGAEPDGDDRAVGLGPFGEAAEADGLDVVEVADDRSRAGARREAVAEAWVEVVEEKEEEWEEEEEQKERYCHC